MGNINKERRAEYNKRYRQNHPEKVRETNRRNNARYREGDIRRRYHLKSTYGISIEHYEQLLEKQGGVCAVCGTSNWGGAYGKPHIDHDHKTGVVRGILCVRCNVAIGLMGDSPDRALEIISYLRKFII